MQSLTQQTWDVVIAGGGLAGLTLALQLRQTFDDIAVLVVEKVARPLPDACHKVGESSVELGSNYLETLGLREYLRENHIIKHGLRFFPGGGRLPLEQRYEIGPAQEPIVPSYQMDRGILENDLREMVVDSGATLIEGATLREPDLGTGGDQHRVTMRTPDGEVVVTARWLIDATGRRALLRKELKLSRGTRHPASSGWFRIDGKFDINDMVPESDTRWHGAEFKKDRWRSTNHFMGPGYWVWVIPLSSGKTSIGVVVHEDTHSFDDVRSLERVWGFLEEHEPVLASAIADREKLDFLCLKGYSHNVTRPWSADRWGMVGEAGAFVDPLYSPGTDFIAFANCFTTELIRVDREGGDLGAKVRELSLQYRALVLGNVDVYRISSPVYGHPSAMLMKIFWDNYAYWCFPCQYYFQKLYALPGDAHTAFIAPGQRFVELSNYMQRLYREWALAAPEEPVGAFAGMPAFPSVLVDAHLALEEKMTPEETLAYVEDRALVGAEIAGEMLVRVLWSLGDAAARSVAEALELHKWDLRVPGRRLEIGRTIGLARRRAMTPIGRDLERTLGRPSLETSDAVMWEILEPLLDTSAVASA